MRYYKISKEYTEILIGDLKRSEYFEDAVKLVQKENVLPKMVADLMINKKLDAEFPEPAGFIRKVLELTQVSYTNSLETEAAVEKVAIEQKKAVDDYKNGKGEVVGFLIGMVQKELKGKGNTNLVREILVKELQKLVKLQTFKYKLQQKLTKMKET